MRKCACPNAHTPFSKSEVNKSSAPLFWVTILVSCGQDWCKKKMYPKRWTRTSWEKYWLQMYF